MPGQPRPQARDAVPALAGACDASLVEIGCVQTQTQWQRVTRRPKPSRKVRQTLRL